jgi:galactokinase
VSLLSVSGRSELSGNHTDHNRGCVIATSVDLDIIAVASARADDTIRIKSAGFPEVVLDISEYNEPDAARFGSPASLIAGVARGFADRSFATGGFDAYTTSNVLGGSGLSSSAAFEDMVGTIFNHLYNHCAIDNVEIGKIAQYAENVFFGKPCGLMDQLACAVGGVIAIDFADTSAPIIEKIPFDVTAAGYCLCIVNTGGNHADLTDDYASVPSEMKSVAKLFGKECLRETSKADVVASIPALRAQLGDRAIMRAMHFFEENERVARQKAALLEGKLDAFLSEVIASGRSSFCYLQNVFTTKNVSEQGISLALCLAENYLSGKDAAWRVHGGGFAGTIQAFVRLEDAEDFKEYMDAAFGEGRCMILRVRTEGAMKLA